MKNLDDKLDKTPNKNPIEKPIKINHKNKTISKNKHQPLNKKQKNDSEKIIKQQIRKQLKFIKSLNPDNYITPLNNMNIHQIVLRRDEIYQ